MTLQRRLALTLVLSSVPLLAGVVWVRMELERRAHVQALGDMVLSRALALGRERCEAAPRLFLDEPPPMLPRLAPRRPGSGPLRPEGPPDALPPPGVPPPGAPPGPLGPHVTGAFHPLRVFLYDATFRPQSPEAPALPPGLRASLESGRARASERRTLAGQPTPLEVVDVAVRTGWADGPCAFVLVQRTGPPVSAPSWDLAASAVPLLAGLIVAVWIASGPLVRRVHALTAAVRRSADTRYAVSVPETGRDEITDLARAFNEAGSAVRAHVATLEQRDRTLREFLANTTHDVMIPLTVLQGHLSTLQKSADAGRIADHHVVVAALQESQYLSSLVHNLGAAAKLEAPDQLVQRHPVDMNSLVERVVERHRPVAHAADVAIEFAVPEQRVTVDGDVTLLEQAVSNVVHNAVRYNRPGGHVAVVLDTTGDADGGFRLRVLDDGPGVSDDTLARLTERRYRDETARQRDPRGLGLGLAITREVADRHGMTLRLGRSPEGGLDVELRR